MYRPARFVPALVFVLTLSGCDLLGDVIEFGFWLGVIAIIVIALVIWGIYKFFD